MAVVNEGVVVVAGGTLPGQDHGVLIALFTIGKGLVGVDNGAVGHTEGVVGVAGVELAVLVGCAAVDFIQTGLGNVHGHVAAIFAVGNGELAGILTPCGNLIGAGGIGEEFHSHACVLVIGQSFTEGIIEIVGGQSGCLRGDGGQGGNDLVFHGVACGTGSGVGEAVGDGSGALVLAGICLGLPDSLFQGGNAGFLLGVDDHIVIPCSAAILGSGVVIAGDGGHGQGDEEGIGGGSDHFGDLGFYQQIQTHGQIFSRGLADFIGGVHSRAAVTDEGFQSVLHGCGVCFQTLG